MSIARIIKAYAGIEYRVYDKGYFHKMKLKTAIVGGVTTSFTVDNNEGIVVGDQVTLVHSSGQRAASERVTIDVSVVGNTFTFTTPPAANYPDGSMVRMKGRFIPDDKFIIRGRLPPGTTGGQNFAEFMSTRSSYGTGGMMNPQPGIFSKTVVDDDGDPPKTEIIMGVYGLPVLYHPTVNVVATVV